MPPYKPRKDNPNDALIQGYVQSIDIANVVLGFKEGGVFAASKSELVRLVFQFAAQMMRQNGKPYISTTEEARSVLEQFGLTGWNPQGKLLRSFAQNLQSEMDKDIERQRALNEITNMTQEQLMQLLPNTARMAAEREKNKK